MKKLLFVLTACLTVFLSPPAKAAPYCASVSHNSGKVSGIAGSVRVIAARKAISGWERKARRKFNEPTINWSRARRKSIRYKNYTPHIASALATGTICIKSARKPNRATGKCPPNDLKCRARLFRYKKKFQTTPDGVKAGLNPQPEPPSNVYQRQ